MGDVGKAQTDDDHDRAVDVSRRPTRAARLSPAESTQPPTLTRSASAPSNR
jgi:hypothetical protein